MGRVPTPSETSARRYHSSVRVAHEEARRCIWRRSKLDEAIEVRLRKIRRRGQSRESNRLASSVLPCNWEEDTMDGMSFSCSTSVRHL